MITLQKQQELIDNRPSELSEDDVINALKRSGQELEKKGLFKRGAEWIGKAMTENTRAFGKTIGEGISTSSKDYKKAQQSELDLSEINQRLGDAIIKAKQEGRDTQDMERIYKENTGGVFKIEEVVPSSQKSTKQIMGEALGTGVEAFGLSSIGGKGVGMFKPRTFIQGAKAGMKEGLREGVVFGGAEGLSRGMQRDEDINELTSSAITGGVLGGGIGTLAGGLLGGGGAKIMNKLEKDKMLKSVLSDIDISKDVKPVKGTKATEEIKLVDTPVSPEDYAKTRLNYQDRLVKDVDGANALKQGFDATDIEYIKKGSIEDRKAMREMFKLAEKKSGDKTSIEMPNKVAGESLLKKANNLMKIKKTVGKNLDATVKEMPSNPMDITDVFDDFIEDLNSNGIRVKSDKTLDFRNSPIARNSKAKKLISEVLYDLRTKNGVTLRTPRNIVNTRRKIFDALDLGKKKNELSTFSKSVLERVRSRLDEPLMEVSDKYKQQTIDYARVRQGIDKFNKLMGKDFDIYNDLAGLRAGEVGNRILGNAPYRASSVMNEVEKLNTDFGYTSSVDLRKQFLFSELLEDVFDITPQRSLRGQVTKAGTDVMNEFGEIASQVVNRDVPGLTKKAFNKMRGINAESKQRALWNIIDEERVARTVKKYKPSIKDIGMTIEDVSKKGGSKTAKKQSLTEQAKKFDSVEEFVKDKSKNNAEKIINSTLSKEYELFDIEKNPEELLGAGVFAKNINKHFSKHIQSFRGRILFESKDGMDKISKILNKKITFFMRRFDNEAEKKGAETMFNYIKKEFENIKTKQQLTEIYNKANKTTLPKKKLPVVSEIKKAKKEGKSFDEYFDKNKVYHGTDNNFESFDFEKTGESSNESVLFGLKGSWFVNNKKVGEGYGERIKENIIDTSNFHKVNAEGKTLNDFRDEMWDAKKKVKDEKLDGLIVENLIDNKDFSKDDIGNHIFVVNKDKIKTKSQLKKLWGTN